MTDQEYKREFALLTEKLGRVPTTRDKEWLELSEQLRRSYLPAEEEGEKVKVGNNYSGARWAFSQRRRPVLEAETPAAGRPVSNAREGAGEALSGPGIIPTGVGGLDSLPGTNPPSRIDDGAMVGARGPGGGIYAKCDGCGRVWERERKRGRPSARCGECK